MPRDHPSSPKKTASPVKQNQKSQTYRQGLKAERWAGWILRAKGYHILERRYKAKGGEIDLIVQKGKTLVFVEVKFRQSLEAALYSITPRNQARIINACQHYLATQDPKDIEIYRFDVIAFAPGGALLPQYQHLEHAFEAF